MENLVTHQITFRAGAAPIPTIVELGASQRLG